MKLDQKSVLLSLVFMYCPTCSRCIILLSPLLYFRSESESEILIRLTAEKFILLQQKEDADKR